MEDSPAREKSTEERDLELRSKKKMKIGYQQVHLQEFMHNGTDDMEVIPGPENETGQTTEDQPSKNHPATKNRLV